MKRRLTLAAALLAVFGLAFSVAGLAAEPPTQKEPKLDPPAKPLKPPAAKEDPREIVARVTRNMESAEEHLKDGKAGTPTQELQEKIIEDLDKLLDQQDPAKQQNKQPQKSTKPDSKPDANPNKDNSKQDMKDPNAKPMPQPNPMPQPGDPKLGNPDKNPQGTAQQPDKDKDKKKGGGGAADKDNKGKKDAKSDNTVSSLVKDPWGHLPKAKRQEMDAYSHEQFMPQYEQLLRQYYQNIAAQSKNKERD